MNVTLLILGPVVCVVLFAAGCCCGRTAASGKRAGGLTEAKTRSVTRLLMVDTVRCALVWVFISYAIAIYSTVRLGSVYTLRELSEPAIYTILGVNLTKVTENIFEHNDGKIFGTSREKITPVAEKEKKWSDSDHAGDL